jgi:hypothetical protein
MHCATLPHAITLQAKQAAKQPTQLDSLHEGLCLRIVCIQAYRYMQAASGQAGMLFNWLAPFAPLRTRSIKYGLCFENRVYTVHSTAEIGAEAGGWVAVQGRLYYQYHAVLTCCIMAPVPDV